MRPHPFLCVPVFLVFIGLGVPRASAQTYWVPTTGANYWTNSANWSAGLPSLTAPAAITNAGTYTVIFNAPSPQTISSVVWSNGTFTLLVTNNSYLAVTNFDTRHGTQTVSVQAGSAFVFSNWYNQSTTLLVNGGAVTNLGVATWTMNSKSITASNGATVYSFGAMNLSGNIGNTFADGASLVVSNNTLNLLSSTAIFSLTNANLTLLGAGSALQLAFATAIAGRLETLRLSGPNASVTNQGTLRVATRTAGNFPGANTGVVEQLNGTFFQGGNIYLGDWSNQVGILDIRGGVFTATNGVFAGSYRTGAGQILVSNATFRADAGLVWLGTAATSQASLEVRSGGAFLATNLAVGAFVGGTGTVSVTGGNLAVTNSNGGALAEVRVGSFAIGGGNVAVDRLVATNAAGTVALNSGNVALGGGTLVSNGVAFAVGDGLGAATLRLNGGGHSFRDGLSVSAKSTLEVTNSTTTISASTVTNLGTVSVMNGQAIFNGNVVNQGAWVSDPSTNTFNGNFAVGPTGYVSAASGDVYAFGGNFLMGSTNPAFNLASARVVFATNGFGLSTTTANHLLSVSNSGALDIGQGYTSFTQVASNYAFGALSIESGDRLTIAGNKGGSATNALYVGWLDIQGNFDTNSYTAVTNALVLALNLPNVNLYYDKYDPRNGWLNANLINDSAAGYNLWSGGGLLLPIPEPSSVALLGGVLALGLAFRRWRRS